MAGYPVSGESFPSRAATILFRKREKMRRLSGEASIAVYSGCASRGPASRRPSVFVGGKEHDLTRWRSPQQG